MKNNEIKSGDNVCYYHGYYTHGSGVNEYGDPEIIDVHEEKQGKVLMVLDNKALCLFYNYADNEHVRLGRVFVNEIHVDWVSIDKLYKEDKAEQEFLFERPTFEKHSDEIDMNDYPMDMSEYEIP